MTLIGGLEVGTQGFGGMALAEVYGPADEREALATLHHAVDAGIRFVDTADIYGRGSNERLVGRLIAERGDELVVATKFGFVADAAPGGPRFRGDPAYLREAVVASLKRLGVDRIPLYYYHRVDPLVPIEETVGALAELVAEGIVGRIGLSEVTADELERAHAVHPIAAVQSEWSIWSRDVESRVIPAAARLGVGFVAYSPLGRGFLAAPVTALAEGDLRRGFPRFDAERLAANAPIGETVRRVAAEEGVTPAQLALAWIAEKARELGVAAVPIPSTRRPERIDENLAAAGIRLSARALAELEPLGALVAGDRARHVDDISQGRERAAGDRG
ncbi:MAG: aldo/keto reductase [Protaetiibacter sp.]